VEALPLWFLESIYCSEVTLIRVMGTAITETISASEIYVTNLRHTILQRSPCEPTPFKPKMLVPSVSSLYYPTKFCSTAVEDIPEFGMFPSSGLRKSWLIQQDGQRISRHLLVVIWV